MWQELYRLTYRYLKGLGLTHEDAEDLVQETLVAVYLHLDGVCPEKLKVWLFTVARHKYIDWLRRTKKEVVLINFPAEKLTDGAWEPEEAVLKEEAREVIAAVMNRLNSSARTLLALKYNLGLTEKEIAVTLKMNPNTVKVKLYRARQQFKAEYIKIWEG